MADLSSIANRLNDVEIDNNAPVSSQTFRRVGSSINYLLDLLNITNGSVAGGPTSALSIFSPAQSYSYSLTLNGSTPIGTPQSLFSFTGAGDRPIKFFQRTSNFDSPELEEVSSLLLPVYYHFTQYPHSFPILRILRNLISDIDATNISFTTYGTLVSRVFVNGIEAGRITRNGGGGSQYGIAYYFEITHAPAGSNAVTVTLDQFRGPTITLSYSGEYVAI